MAIEKYIAIASLGLFIMFVGEIVTIYIFMIDPPREIEPTPKILQFISIGIAPAVVLAGVSFIMARRYGSKIIGTLITAGGIILLAGMAYSFTLVDDIEPEYREFAVELTPVLFMVVAIPVIVVGAMLYRIRKPKPKKDYF